MNTDSTLVIYCLFLLSITSTVSSIPFARIVNASYSSGVSFSKTNYTTADACLCSCLFQPHCLSCSITKLSTTILYCQLYATYPSRGSQLTPSSISSVSVLTDRTSSSVYIINGTQLSHPPKLFSDDLNPWVPIFKIFTGNNQSFFWLNSSASTTLKSIPAVPINQSQSHWFSVLLSQWNTYSYKPTQVALAFIVNRTKIIELLIFNNTQSDVYSWFNITRVASTQFWPIASYRTTSQGLAQMIAVYTDSTSTRAFNTNFKSENSCSNDFYGFFFTYGGYSDTCIAAAVSSMSTVAVPTIFYSPTSGFTNGSLSSYRIADGLMGFVR